MFLNANALNLLLLPDRAFFGRCSVRTTAIRAHLGSITLLFMFILPTPLTFCCCSAALACVAKPNTIKTSQRVGNKQVHFHFQISNSELLWHVRSIEGKKQAVGWNNLPLFLHRYTVNFDNTLKLLSSSLISTSDKWRAHDI